MFCLGEWVAENLIRGYRKQMFAAEKVAVLTANYVAREILTGAEAEEIANAVSEPMTPPCEVPDAETEAQHG